MKQRYKESITLAMQIILPIVVLIAAVEGLIISGVITTEPDEKLKNELYGYKNEEEYITANVTAEVIINYGDEK